MVEHQLFGEALCEYLREKLDAEVCVAMYHEDVLKLMSTNGKFEYFLTNRRISEVQSALKLVDLAEANAPFPTNAFFGTVTSRDLNAAPMIGVSGIVRKSTPIRETDALFSKILADPTSVPEQARLEPNLGRSHALE